MGREGEGEGEGEGKTGETDQVLKSLTQRAVHLEGDLSKYFNTTGTKEKGGGGREDQGEGKGEEGGERRGQRVTFM
jgi:hypothetical protein